MESELKSEKVKMETMGRLRLKFFTLILTLCLCFLETSACPTDCSCKWKGGKQSVECLNRSLRTFPGPIDPGTQVLDLGGNSFETLPSDHFMRLSLINLQKVYLARCRLNHINSRAFRGLSNLVDLDLSNNALREAPTSAFLDCEGLMRLVLSGNPITHVLSKAFVGLRSLTSLEMSNCGTEVIEKGGFEGLDRLEWLKLDGNKLRRLDGLELLPITLKGVWLEENPWECDCRILELRTWIVQAKVGSSAEPRCRTPPRLVNATLKELRLEAFACPPELSPTTMYQKIGEGKNVSLLCKVSSTPESTLEWWFNSQPINNASLNILIETTTSRDASGGTQKKSELLILNATAEENGTFLCLAKNPAGTASANFTLRVLSVIDPDSYAENVTSFVGTYSNLFLIVLSAVAVVGLVILLLGMSLLLCKCSRLFGSRGRGGRRVILDGHHKSDGGKTCDHSKDGHKNVSGGSLNGPKMERHLSETSTITTQTKSNGSVFLLSTSSELGDSNPDLIEGAKRVEADGHETVLCSHHSNNGGSTYLHPSHGNGGHSHALQGTPTLLEQFPGDYGLPKGLNVTTLVRRSPSYPLNNGDGGTLPRSYDLAKYPKEYINPSPFPPNAYIYAYSPGPGDGYQQQPLYTYVQHGGPTYAVYGTQEYMTYAPPPAHAHPPPSSSSSCTCILEETEILEPETKVVKIDPGKAKSRIQRQVTTTINESPDEGYEDEAAEGAEV